MIVEFIIKADVSKMSLAECSTDDQVIDTLTDILTDKTAEYGEHFWLDDVLLPKGVC